MTPKHTKAKKRGRLVTSDEDWLWREVTKDVRAYRPVSRPAPQPPDLKQAKTQAATGPGAQSAAARPPIRMIARPVDASGTGVDGATDKRLTRGEIVPEATLDLHGMTQNHAHAALDRFISHSVMLSRRCVLIVTGKGARQKDRDSQDAPWMRSRTGVLRALVPLWLEQHASFGRIAKIKSAHPRHGGTGALYIYLRSKA